MASILRHVRSNRILRHMAALAGAGYILLADRTTRWVIEGAEIRDALRTGEGRWLIPVWHGRLLIIPADKTRRMNVRAMISNNRDGEIIATCIRYFGAPSVRGSTHDPRKADKDKGGRAAFEAALAAFRDNEHLTLVLTPDGPRGPRMRCQPGVANLSAQLGVAVIPFAYSTARGKILRSWDRFLLPRLFDRGAKVFGAPIPPPADPAPGALEAHRLTIEAALIAVTRRADELVGRMPVEPEAPAG